VDAAITVLQGGKRFVKLRKTEDTVCRWRFAEYVIADSRYVGHLKSDVNFLEIAYSLCRSNRLQRTKRNETKPGEWVAISGIGGLGHVAVQYAKAMGMHVAAIDVADDKLELAKKLGADLVVNAKNTDPGEYLHKEVGGMHGAHYYSCFSNCFQTGNRCFKKKRNHCSQRTSSRII
jgi:propanol-preferring alcohol dehydrogenase